MNRKTLVLTFFIAVTIFNGFALHQFESLKARNCVCSKDMRRTYIYAYLIMTIVFNGIIILLFIFDKQGVAEMLISYATLPMLIASMIYIGAGFQYANILKKKECNCINNVALSMFGTASAVLPFTNMAFIIILAGIILGGWFAKKRLA